MIEAGLRDHYASQSIFWGSKVSSKLLTRLLNYEIGLCVCNNDRTGKIIVKNPLFNKINNAAGLIVKVQKYWAAEFKKPQT